MAYRTPSYRLDSPLPTLPEVEPASAVDSAEKASYDQRRHSNNPYRQGRGNGMLSPDILPSGERKKTPIRAVFNDLSAAHSIITTGKAKSGSANKGVAQEQDSIPLQDLSPADHSEDYFRHMPLPQLPALTFGESRRRSSSQIQDVPQSDAVRSPALLQQVLPESSSSILHNVKSAIASISAPPNDKQGGTVAARWPKPSPGIDSNPKNERPSLTEGVRSANGLTKPQVKRYTVRPANNWDHANLNGSSVYPSSPPIGDAPSLPAASHRYTNSSYASESVQYNSTRDRVYSAASSKPAFLDEPYTQPVRKPMHSAHLSEQVSIPDGSTVGNIYNHYLQTDPLDDFSEDDEDDEPFGLSLPELKSANAHDNRTTTATSSSATDQSKPTALSQRLEDRSNRYNRHPSSEPPQYSLPKLPNIPGRALAPSSTHLGQSSSYGDTRELLNMTEPSNLRIQGGLTRSEAQQDLRSSMIDSASDKSASPVRARNPFAETPRVVVQDADERQNVYEGDSDFDVGRPATTRLPLQREVSEALRRASRLSTYSTGSVDSIIDNYRWFGQKAPSTAASRLSGSIATPQIVRRNHHRHSEDIADQSRGMPETLSSFYAPGAVSPSWIQKTSQGTVVRRPIIPPLSPRAQRAARQSKQDQRQAIVEDENEEQGDWETVGESGFGTEASYGYFIGGEVKRAGSSLANLTDDGNLPDFDDFGSTNRIAQHPAHPSYESEYRQRDLKGSRVPVFAPVYREHKVNGYLNDSTRTRPHPTSSGYAPPPSLGRTHPNPFATPPPQVLPARPLAHRGIGIGMFKSKNPNHFKPSLQTLCTESEEADHDDEPKTYMTEEERRTWMREFSKHKLTLRTENEFSKSSPTKSRPSSWQRMIDQAADVAIKDFNGTFITDETKNNAASDQKLRSSQSSGKLLSDQLAKIKPSSKRDSAPKTQNTLSTIPSGARYQDLDGTSRERAKEEARRAAYRQSSNDYAKRYPTNQLRPLSLVDSLPSSSRRPGQSAAGNGHRTSAGAPRLQGWRALYSPSQLRDIEEAGRADRMANIPEGLSQSSFFSDNTPDGGVGNRFLFENPTLTHWKPEDSFVDEKTRCSIAVLCFSTLFPPFLLLYILGTLDPIIIWWTNGRFVTYAKKQRRLALIFLITWCCAIVAALIAFLAYWFSNLRTR